MKVNWQSNHNMTDRSASMFIYDVILPSDFWRRNCWLKRCDTIRWIVTFSEDKTSRKSSKINWKWDKFIGKNGEERSRVEASSRRNVGCQRMTSSRRNNNKFVGRVVGPVHVKVRLQVVYCKHSESQRRREDVKTVNQHRGAELHETSIACMSFVR